MGTKFTTLAAPVDASTGDRRRFAEDALTSQPLPMPLRWVRADVGEHNGAITLGAIQGIELSGTEARVGGVLFDDVDPARMPRLAEDVAEAMKLIEEGVLGLSVDLDAVDAILVRLGTDTPATEDDFNDPDAELEMLITKGRIRSGTLVAIPAFIETNHTIELEKVGEEVEDEEVDETVEEVDDGELYALVASMGTADLVPLAAFTPPVPITGPTPVTYDFAATPPVVYGHVLTWDTCHEGFSDSCLLAPRDPAGGSYHDFHTYRVETDGGTIYAGRITAGGQHAPLDLDAHGVRRHHDAMARVADVRAVEDEFGLLICGPLRPGLDDDTLRILSRRKVSADWRETADGLAAIEILALPPGPRQVSEPGFPVEAVRAGFAAGRQVALVASLGPEAPDPVAARPEPLAAMVREVYAAIKEEEAKAHADAVAAESVLAELADVERRDRDAIMAELAGILEG